MISKGAGERSVRGHLIKVGLHGLGLGLTAVSLLLSGAVAHAQSMPSGDQWLRQCSSTVPSETRACFGFLSGVEELNEFLGPAKQYCRPGRITLVQMKAIVEKYLQANPAKLHLPFAGLAIEALRSAFPCPKS